MILGIKRFIVSGLGLDSFVRQPSIEAVINTINTTLFNVGKGSIITQFSLWETIDSVIELEDCVSYSYLSDGEHDPFDEEGNIWSLNYFFFNKRIKRVLFFTLRSVR